MGDEQPSVQSPATPESPSPQATDTNGVVAGERTVEQVEAEWKYRLSQKDRAHAAAETVLQEQIATLERRMTQASPQAQGQVSSADPEELVELRNELAAERRQRVVAERKAKYPALAEFLGDGGDVFSGSEIDLAKLNAGLEQQIGSTGSLIAPTAPRRAAPVAAKPLSEKSKEELLDDLKIVAPAYEAWRREIDG